jgi:tetratricopeptide (TPR) repeat protein
VGRGGAFADYDNDGDLDLFVVNHGGPGTLLRNDGGNRNAWLQVALQGARGNSQAIGAIVRVMAGGRTQVRHVGAQSSYLSQNTPIEHFGLGTQARVDTVEVRWPGGGIDTVTAVDANHRLTISEERERAPLGVQRATTSAALAGSADRVAVQEFWRLLREANAHRVARRNAQAMDAFSRALELNPRHEDALYYLGSLRLDAGHFDGAAQAWRTLLSVNATSARAHSRLGEIHACLDSGAPFQLDSAAHHFQRAHEINKEENGPLLRLGEVALLRGDRRTALRYVDLVLRTHGDNATAQVYRDYLTIRSGTMGPSARAVPHVAGEGDTKRGAGNLTRSTERCSALHDIVERARAGDAKRAYRSLDSLVSAVR